MSARAEANRELGYRINREIWNERHLDRLPDYFSPDFVADRGPNGSLRGLDELRAAVERSHATFEGFREDIRCVVADDERVVIHFTIRGRQTGQWGPIPPTGREVEHDEIVIMTVQDGKVVHQTGVIDDLTALRQVGVAPARR